MPPPFRPSKERVAESIACITTASSNSASVRNTARTTGRKRKIQRRSNMRIYTRGGDKGRTGIHGGERVDKDDIRIEANGTLDEVNAQIGIVRALLPPEHEWQDVLGKIQRELMVVMSHVATPSAIRDKNPNSLSEDLVSFCEQQIDLLTGQMQDNGFFILPGGTLISAHLQLARTIARRAERRLWTLYRKDPLPEEIMQFVNRLSDLLFTMARYEMFQQDHAEERWNSFLYNRKKKE